MRIWIIALLPGILGSLLANGVTASWPQLGTPSRIVISVAVGVLIVTLIIAFSRHERNRASGGSMTIAKDIEAKNGRARIGPIDVTTAASAEVHVAEKIHGKSVDIGKITVRDSGRDNARTD